MRLATIPALVAALCSAVIAADQALPSADTVLRELKAGNDHHVAKRYQHPHQSAARQRELAATQAPHAIILSCADSRVAPEIILDQGLGDLFDVRVAGNVATDTELASIEYAASHLHTPLVVVMAATPTSAIVKVGTSASIGLNGDCQSGFSMTPRLRFVDGYSVCSRSAIAESSACACERVTPGFTRTKPSIHRAPRSSSL